MPYSPKPEWSKPNAGKRRTKTKRAPACATLGRELTGPEREAAGLSHARKWRKCLNPTTPLGPNVCRCAGCGPKCPGYEKPKTENILPDN